MSHAMLLVACDRTRYCWYHLVCMVRSENLMRRNLKRYTRAETDGMNAHRTHTDIGHAMYPELYRIDPRRTAPTPRRDPIARDRHLRLMPCESAPTPAHFRSQFELDPRMVASIAG